MDEKISDAINQLNEVMGEFSPYKLDIVDPKEIVPIGKNARYMTKMQFDNLVNNISKDRNLSSVPFCWKTKGKYICLSGNHRVQAAVRANVPKILILYTDARMKENRAVAIQLSHNAISGQDNMQILEELWNKLNDSVDLKGYSGLNDTLMQTLDLIDVEKLVRPAIKFEEISFMFFAPEVEHIGEVLKKLGKIGSIRYAFAYDEFAPFFTLLLKFKESAGIINSSTALLKMVDIVNEWLEDKADAEKAK